LRPATDTKVSAQSPPIERILLIVTTQKDRTARPVVVVVDDDESVRESLPDLLHELGFAARAFASAEDFLASDCIARTRCLLLDIGLPGMSGPELHRKLIRQGHRVPTVFITARAEESLPPDLLNREHGAITCLFKPFSDEDLRAALERAIGLP
jgi:FixJ family two-component response regulator